MKIRVQYFAVLREQRGLSEEEVESSARTPAELYLELKDRYSFSLPQELVKVAVNGSFVDIDHQLQQGDQLVFIPPVSGG